MNKEKIKEFIFVVLAVLVGNIITLVALMSLIAIIFPD